MSLKVALTAAAITVALAGTGVALLAHKDRTAHLVGADASTWAYAVLEQPNTPPSMFSLPLIDEPEDGRLSLFAKDGTLLRQERLDPMELGGLGYSDGALMVPGMPNYASVHPEQQDVQKVARGHYRNEVTQVFSGRDGHGFASIATGIDESDGRLKTDFIPFARGAWGSKRTVNGEIMGAWDCGAGTHVLTSQNGKKATVSSLDDESAQPLYTVDRNDDELWGFAETLPCDRNAAVTITTGPSDAPTGQLFVTRLGADGATHHRITGGGASPALVDFSSVKTVVGDRLFAQSGQTDAVYSVPLSGEPLTEVATCARTYAAPRPLAFQGSSMLCLSRTDQGASLTLQTYDLTHPETAPTTTTLKAVMDKDLVVTAVLARPDA